MLMLSEGQMSDHTGAKLLYPHLPAAETPRRPHVLLGDMYCGYRHLLALIIES